MPEKSERAASERTCAGCREHDAREALVRLAVSGDPGLPLVPDLRGRLGGRGVSVHPSRRCLALAANKGGLARSLSRPVTVEVEPLARAIEEQLLVRAKGLLLGGLRARKLAVGTDAVVRTIENGTIALLVVAEDAAGRSVDLTERVRAAGKRVAVLADKASLGALASRAEVAVVAVLDEGIAAELDRVASMLACMMQGSIASQSVGSGASPSKSEAEAE